MPITMDQRRRMKRSHWTDYEIDIIANAKVAGTGEDQPYPDFHDRAWQNAHMEHEKLYNAFMLNMPLYYDQGRADEEYENFIMYFLASVGHERDPWIFLDQFYFRKARGKVTKARYEEAARAVEIVQRWVRYAS